MEDIRSFYFVQFTDIHLGGSDVKRSKEAEENLRVAIKEVNLLPTPPAFIISTGDCVNYGKDNLHQYQQLISSSLVPVYSLPASHDLALELADEINIKLSQDYSHWEEIVGPKRQAFDKSGVRFILFEPWEMVEEKGWHSYVNNETAAWVKNELEQANKGPIVVVFHTPIIPLKSGGYMGTWQDSNADEFIRLLSRYNILALITGHRHRNEDWIIKGLRQIQSGSLYGYQLSGVPPHYVFPVRPGYRIFQIEGERLHYFWRELRVNSQVNLVWVGPAHTMGPRPQVRPPVIFSDVHLLAKAYSINEKIDKVEYSVEDDRWQPMRKCFNGLWSEWEATFSVKEIKKGSAVIVVRAYAAKKVVAYDYVPVVISDNASSASAESGPEMLFEIITMGSEMSYIEEGSFPGIPWRPRLQSWG